MQPLRDYIRAEFDNSDDADACIAWIENFGAHLHLKYDEAVGIRKAKDLIETFRTESANEETDETKIQDLDKPTGNLTVGEVYAYLTRLLKFHPDIKNLQFAHCEFGGITPSTSISYIEGEKCLIVG